MASKKEKEYRQSLIRRIIRQNDIYDQRKLKELLANNGLNVGQGTISRDLLELKIQKNRPSPRHRFKCYCLPEENHSLTPEMIQFLGIGGFRTLQFSGNLAVIKTDPGYASPLAYKIEALQSSLLLGTIAGHDTILVICSEKTSHSEITKILSDIIPELAL